MTEDGYFDWKKKVEIRRYSITRLKPAEKLSGIVSTIVEIRRYSITRLKLRTSRARMSRRRVEIRRYSITRLKLVTSNGVQVVPLG